MMIGRAPKSKRFWLIAAGTTILIALLLSLGVWQVQRLQWKTALIASLENKSALQAAPNLAPEKISPSDPAPVMFFGRYRPEHTIFVRNGNHMVVYMPFETVEGATVLMRRGIMKPADMAGKIIAQSEEPGPVSVVGVPLPRPPSIPLIKQSDPNSVTWTLLDWGAVETKLKSETLMPYIVAVLDEPNDTLPLIQFVPKPRNEHLQYAVFWFTMAFAAAALFGRLLLTPPRREEI